MADPVIIRTERLVLRPPLPQDAPHIVERLGAKDVAWNLGRVPHPYQMADAEAWLEKIPKSWAEDSSYSFAITHPIDGMIGCVSLRLLPFEVWEVGYWLGEEWWGLGYMTEAAAALLRSRLRLLERTRLSRTPTQRVLLLCSTTCARRRTYRDKHSNVATITTDSNSRRASFQLRGTNRSSGS